MDRETQERLVRTGAGTPGGRLQRAYWQPVALSTEVDRGGAPVPVTILGEDLVLYRDARGALGLIGRRCPHRGTDLCYGRVEEQGLRCIYHGWLFDAAGACLDQPGVPDRRTTVLNRVRMAAYPAHEAGGLIFTYMGEGEPPLFPAYEFLDTDDRERVICRIRIACNFFQGIEGNLDQVHLSFLHRIAPHAVQAYLTRPDYFKATTPGSTSSTAALHARDVAPLILPRRTGFGMREIVTRAAPEGRFLKIENLVLPGFAVVPGSTLAQGGYLVNWHVPIDDENHWKYHIIFRRGGLDKDAVMSRLLGDEVPFENHRFAKDGEFYRQDRDEMKRGTTFAGLGQSFAFHDVVIVEAQGAICDRTQETLGAEDKSVALVRRVMLDAMVDVEEGRDPPHVIRNPADNRFPDLIVLGEVIPAEKDPDEHVRERVAERDVIAAGGDRPSR